MCYNYTVIEVKMTNKALNIKAFLEKCKEFENCKLLFIDKKIKELLDLVAQNSQIYDLVSECLESFNRDKELDKAFVTDGQGRSYFLPPKEEFKVLALDFCVLADIASKKIGVDTLISKFFKEGDGKKDYEQFVEKIVYSFRDLVAEAFGVSSYAVDFISNSEQADGEEEAEQFKDIVETPIERVSTHLVEGCDLNAIFDKVRGLARNMLSMLEQERYNEMVGDCKMICHSMIIACLDQNFDMLSGLAAGLKYLGKNIKSIRFYTKELVAVVFEQIDWDN